MSSNNSWYRQATSIPKRPDEQHLGDGDLDYTIPAEIVYPKYFHKRGMFAAARTGDDENPERASSATQFYIVTGKFFTEMELDKMEKEQGITFTPEPTPSLYAGRRHAPPGR